MTYRIKHDGKLFSVSDKVVDRLKRLRRCSICRDWLEFDLFSSCCYMGKIAGETWHFNAKCKVCEGAAYRERTDAKCC